MGTVRKLQRAGVGVLVIDLAAHVVQLCTTAHASWDFDAYFYAALAWRQGLDPYAPEAIAAVAHRADVYGYQYPPLLLPMFDVVSRLGHPAALIVYQAMLIGALLALMFVVGVRILGRPLDPFLLVAMLGTWNYAVAITMNSGNAEIFTVLATWAGIAWLCDEREARFSAATVVAALPKLQPASFALAGFAVLGRRGWRSFGGVVVGVAVWLLANALISPRLTHEWLGIALGFVQQAPPSNWVQPSLPGLVQSLVPGAAPVLALSLMVAIGAVGAHALRSASGLPAVGRACLAVVTIALLWPRLKDYTFLTFVPAVAWLGRDLYDSGGRRRILGVMTGATAFGFSLVREPSGAAAPALIANAPYVFALALWAALVARASVPRA